jgi:hypothetical protein
MGATPWGNRLLRVAHSVTLNVLRMDLTRDAALRAQHALTEAEIEALIERCPEESRWAFAGWLRGTHQLDGDPVTEHGTRHHNTHTPPRVTGNM